MSPINHPPVGKQPPNILPNLLRALLAARSKSGAIFLFLFAFSAVFSINAQIIEYNLPQPNPRPVSVIFAPDGAYWITEFTGNRLGRIDTNGVVSEPKPFHFTSNTYPSGIVIGPDSNIWCTEANVDKICRISRGTNGAFTNGVLTEFPIHPNVNTNSQPAGIAVGPDGNLWFVEYSTSVIGVMNTNGVMLHEYGAGVLQTNSQPRNIAAGPDGALWFTEFTYGRIGHITTAGVITEFTIPNSFSNCEPLDIIAGPDGAMWFTEFNSNRIGRLTVTSNYSDFLLPSTNLNSAENGSQGPYDLAVGGDGNIWFTEFFGCIVSRMTLAGVITEFPTPTGGSNPTGIASGPDKNIWFGEYATGYVGSFLLPTLSITVNSNSQFVLTWPSTATDYTLQGNSNFLSTNWINLTSPPPVIVSNLYVYTNTIAGLDFFRLFQTTIP